MSLHCFPRLRVVVSAAVFAGAFACVISLAAQLQGIPPGGPVVLAGPGGPGGGEREVVAQFDKDRDKRLNAAERKAARAWLQSQPAPARWRPRRRGGPGFPGGGNAAPPEPGARLAPADVRTFPNAPTYDMSALRTFFFEFENADWEAELADFYNTDVEVPATLTVDGKVYRTSASDSAATRRTSSCRRAGSARSTSRSTSCTRISSLAATARSTC